MSTTSHPLHGPMFVSLVILFIFACLGCLALLFLLLWVIISRSPSTTGRSSLGRSAAVVVLGDVGRSPRMCYHAQSLAEDGWRVAVVGYQGTPPPPPLRRSSVKHHHLSKSAEAFVNRLPRTGKIFTLISAPLKVITQSASLFWTLSNQVKPPPELILVQTPPALPTLFVVQLVGILLGSKIIIDWHNLSYTILSLRFKSTSPIVRLTRLLEKWTGKGAFAHLCVTQSLKSHLENTWHVHGPVEVLYDRPPSHFRRAAGLETHKLLSDLIPALSSSIQDWLPECSVPNSTAFTMPDGTLREDRPALVVSSTSWTADEDFSMLLRAAQIYEKRAHEINNRRFATPKMSGSRPTSPTLLDSPSTLNNDEDDRRSFFRFDGGGSSRHKNRRASASSVLPEAVLLPKVLFIITGKGELRDEYVEKIAKLEKAESWQYIRIRTAWLKSDEYPVLLGSADVGVSLHSSSSGMDLPMKVVDMLGCETPVCALGFPCLGELIQHGQNGLIFYTASELASQLESLLGRHPEPTWLLTKMAAMESLFPEQQPTTVKTQLKSSPLRPLRLLGHKSASSLASETSQTSSPPASPLLASPPSPLPSFTLLSSPTFPPVNDMHHHSSNDNNTTTREGIAARSRHWSGNWKRVVRPLLVEADEAEEEAERIKKFESNRGVVRKNNSKWPLLYWRGGGAKTIIKRSESLKSALSTPRSSYDLDRDEGLSNGAAAAAATSGLPSRFYSSTAKDDDSILPRSSPKQLRHRVVNRSQTWSSTPVSSQSQNALAALQIEDTTSDGIPGISISPAIEME